VKAGISTRTPQNRSLFSRDICPREHCPQRAFPALDAQLAIDENLSAFTPYPIQGSGRR
jgi:predicted transcriptional regulator